MVEVPDDAPPARPARGDDYDSVSAHDDGLVIAPNDNDRYRRVCVDPVAGEEGPRLYFCHHTHEGTG
ncbi:hypothetical protein BRD00_05315 [Halobacteriales archaeon QS_8_69_26]|nr:MAG: hypothetical protein BRD00_05315 [Halobacteriales archaeon QS_8_69_26]